jgi:rhamnose transport system ATP-binding protein
LQVQNLSRAGAFENISFQVHAGEIVALAGLVGSGRSEIARCIFGLDQSTSGTMQWLGKVWEPHTPRDAIRAGIALVPEDRRGQGLVMQLSVRENLSLPALASNLADLCVSGCSAQGC